MSRIDESIEEVRDRTSPGTREILGMIRRMAVTLTDGAFWQVVGHLLLDGVTREVRTAEPYSGVGFYARPAIGANAEAIMAHVGGAQNPALIATRDEGLRAAVDRQEHFDQNETAMFNTAVVARCRRTGKFTVTVPGGTPREIAFADELNDLRAFVMQQFVVAGHTHVVSGTATTTVAAIILPVPAPTTAYPGTTVLQGQ